MYLFIFVSTCLRIVGHSSNSVLSSVKLLRCVSSPPPVQTTRSRFLPRSAPAKLKVAFVGPPLRRFTVSGGRIEPVSPPPSSKRHSGNWCQLLNSQGNTTGVWFF